VEQGAERKEVITTHWGRWIIGSRGNSVTGGKRETTLPSTKKKVNRLRQPVDKNVYFSEKKGGFSQDY